MGFDALSHAQGRAYVAAERNAAIEEHNAVVRRLNNSHVEYVKAEAERIGFAHLAKMLVDELQRIDPNNALCPKATQKAILGHKAAETASEMGYIYDPQNRTIVGKRRQ